ncbi:MAG: GntR family transcriptional regulator [Armatimonadetes bacterium]|nr:GntR family transcriptional regulator [Candidatus Hippobium faecium]
MKTIDIYKTIKNQIINKKYSLGDRLPTEHELMAEFGVGRSTIREVLTHLTNEAIIEKRHGLGSYITRIPASKGTICICVRFDNMTSSTVWYPTLIRSINNYSKTKGYDTLIAVGYGETINEIKESIDAYFRKPFSKEIVAIVNTMAFDLGEEFEVPVINIDAAVHTSRNSVCITYNNIFAEAKKLFAEYGYKDYSIIYVKDSIEKAGELIYNEMNSLVNSFTDKEKNRLPIYNVDTCRSVFDRWYNSSDRTQALFIQDDGILDNLIPYFYENNIKIPEDLAVITYANTHKKFAYPTAFHCFGSDHDTTAKILIENLDTMLKGEDIGQIKIAPYYRKGNSL